MHNLQEARGTAADPWQIATCEQLQLIDAKSTNAADTLGANFIVTQNIDCSDTENWNGGAGFDPIGENSDRFTGVFNGDGYTISKVTINRPSTDYVGVFGFTQNATILNTELVNANVTGRNNVGGFAGTVLNGSTIVNVSVMGSIAAVQRCGGLAGQLASASIIGSHAIGSVTVSGEVAGGLVGVLNNFIQPPEIINSHATVDVTGDNHIGGLVGDARASSLTSNAYATGKVTSSGGNVGGLIGSDNNRCTSTASYFDSTSTMQRTSACGALPKTTQQLQSPTLNTGIYANWDPSIWDFGTSTEYPTLRRPTIVRAETNTTGDSILVIFNKSVADSGALPSDFTISASGLTASKLRFSSDSLTIGLSGGPIAEGASLTFDYAQGTGTIEDGIGKILADTSSVAVTNRVDVTDPMVSRAETNAAGDTILVVFNEPITDNGSTGSDFNPFGGICQSDGKGHNRCSGQHSPFSFNGQHRRRGGNQAILHTGNGHDRRPGRQSLSQFQ